MTLPYEEAEAVLRAERFLVSLLDPKETPRVPRIVRRGAGSVLRHFPSQGRIRQLFKQALADKETFWRRPPLDTPPT